MVITKARQARRVGTDMRRELGEWDALNRAADPTLATSNRPTALIPSLSTGRGPGLMVPQPGRVPPVDTSVYLYYDKHDLLIYVGITHRGIVRNQEHSSKPWWPYVTRQDVEHFDSRPAAEARERELIRQFRPPFNTQHNPGAQLTREAYLAWANADTDEHEPGKIYSRLRRRIAVSTLSQEPGRLVLITRPEHYPITARLVLPSDKRVFIWGQLGRVLSVEHRNMFAVVTCKTKKEFPATSRGLAMVRQISQKRPAYELTSIGMESACPVPREDIALVHGGLKT